MTAVDDVVQFLGSLGLYASGLVTGVLVTVVILRTVIRWGGKG